MLTLQPQRFESRNLHHPSTILMRNGYAIAPIDPMRVQYKFVLRLQIIKHGHFTVTHDGKPLFFERMQPANKDMSLHSTTEFAVRQGGVKNLRVNITSSATGDVGRKFA